jgi:hypothetical protein
LSVELALEAAESMSQGTRRPRFLCFTSLIDKKFGHPLILVFILILILYLKEGTTFGITEEIFLKNKLCKKKLFLR